MNFFNQKNYKIQTELLMTQESIQVYARVRPCAEPANDFPGVKIDEVDSSILRIDLPPGLTQANLTQEAHYRFPFKHIFWKDSLQDDILNIVAVPLIDHAMEGYNATLFAYGQTGSGKTFTITGDGTPTCMGIVPRAIQYVYNNIPSYSDFEISISYLEIYNNVAYDLLTNQSSEKASSIQRLEDLKRVQIADTGKETICKSLSIEPAPDIEAAHLQFWTGEAARQKAATVNNKYSSRSHTIFTFYFKFTQNVTTNENGTEFTVPTPISSKINFVDLAGSEKYETLSDDITERKLEARHINKSLSTLQSVILGINGKKSHIPFRDSTLTRFLKDSLVGNVKTAMISALSTNKNHISETLSTCRFAESVARVTTTSKINIRELPPHEMITRLRSEIAHLRQSIARASGAYYTPSSNTNSQEQDENDNETASNGSHNSEENENANSKSENDTPSTAESSETPKVRKISDIEAVELKKQAIQFVENQSNHLDAYAPEQAQFCFQFLKELIRRGNTASMTVSRLQEKVDDTKKTMDNLLLLMSARQSNQSNGKPLIAKQSAYLEFCKNHEKFSILRQMKKALKEGNTIAQKKYEEFIKLRKEKNDLQDKISKVENRLDELEHNGSKGKQIENDPEVIAAREELQALENQNVSVLANFNKCNDDMKRCKEQIIALNRDAHQIQNEMHNEFEKFWVNVVMAHSTAQKNMNANNNNNNNNTNSNNSGSTPTSPYSKKSSERISSSMRERRKRPQVPLTTEPQRNKPL